MGLIGSSGLQEPGHLGAVGIHGDEPKRGGGEDVAPGVPPGPDGQHPAAGQPQAPGEQIGLAAFHVPIVLLERGRPAQAVEQVAGRVGLRAQRGRSTWSEPRV